MTIGFCANNYKFNILCTKYLNKIYSKTYCYHFRSYLAWNGDYLHTTIHETRPAQLGYTWYFSQIWPNSIRKVPNFYPIHHFVVFSSTPDIEPTFNQETFNIWYNFLVLLDKIWVFDRPIGYTNVTILYDSYLRAKLQS